MSLRESAKAAAGERRKFRDVHLAARLRELLKERLGVDTAPQNNEAIIEGLRFRVVDNDLVVDTPTGPRSVQSLADLGEVVEALERVV